MKRTDFNELIEKAFSMGYEEAQKEFGAVKRENKKKKRTYELLKGINDFGNEYFSGDSVQGITNKIIRKEREKQKDTYWKNNPIKNIHDAILQKTKFDVIANRKRLPDYFDKVPKTSFLIRESGYDHVPFNNKNYKDIKNISKELNESRKTK